VCFFRIRQHDRWLFSKTPVTPAAITEWNGLFVTGVVTIAENVVSGNRFIEVARFP
jgi:hypothetical protein